jgi:hypothetical protein
MKILSFEWSEGTRLTDELVKPLDKVFVAFEHPAWGPMSVTLWRLDGTGLRIDSKMHDVAPGREVGVLRFARISAPPKAELSAAIDVAFSNEITALKLTIEESGTSADSGIILRADSQEITIVAGAFPFSLAVSGAFEAPNIFDPEYPIERYIRGPIA